MANLFSKELTKGMLNTAKKYKAEDKASTTVEDGIYEVRIENVIFKQTKGTENPLLIFDCTDLNSKNTITSLFVLSVDMQEINLQHLRNLLCYCDIKDFTKDELKDSDEMLKKLRDTIDHKVKLELKTSEKGFQATSFVSSLDEDSDEDEDIDYDDEEDDDE